MHSNDINIHILVLLICLTSFFSDGISRPIKSNNAALHYRHPHPVYELQRRVNESLTKRQLIGDGNQTSCQTGNPVDDCWRCDTDWKQNRQRLADCGIGFGQQALGGKGGEFYVVTDPSDDPANPQPGTLRYATTQTQPLWITFESDMVIQLKLRMDVYSFKTIDGRGVEVQITGAGCVGLYNVTNVIIHNLHIRNCGPSGEWLYADGDGIAVFGSTDVWIDHCSLSNCTDGLIDVTVGSTRVTLSNNYFKHHDEAVLLGHSDDYEADKNMQVTVAFNYFGEGLVQRMPRCRWGYVHVVNNHYQEWGKYAIGGSAAPTIFSEGNKFIAPSNPFAKQVTARMANESEWRKWNWTSQGDIMLNGAYFVPSGDGIMPISALDSVSVKSAEMVDQLTKNAGVFRNNTENRNTNNTLGWNGGRRGPEISTKRVNKSCVQVQQPEDVQQSGRHAPP